MRSAPAHPRCKGGERARPTKGETHRHWQPVGLVFPRSLSEQQVGLREHPYRHTVPPVRVPEALAISPLKMHCASNRISTSLTPRKEWIRDLL